MIIKTPKFRTIRYGIASAVGLATYAVVSAAVKNNTAEPETKTQKVTVGIGSFVLATMVAEKASAWADRQLLGINRTWNDAKQQVEDQSPTQQ